MRFRAGQHLRRQLDFQHVRTHGRRHECGAFTLWYVRQVAPVAAADAPLAGLPVPVKASRVGVVASRSAVGNAVQRARAKRRLREVFRSRQELVPPGYDLLLVARTVLNRLEYHEIDRKFTDACEKLFPPVQA